MIRDHFRVLKVDLSTGRGKIEEIDGRDACAGGSGLAALLFSRMGFSDRSWEDPEQPLIFAIGPLTGYFPLMSKVVCAFKSPYHDQYAESHGGGRSALSMRFADLDALVITGKARRPSCLVVGSRTLEVKDVHYLWGKSVQRTGQMLRGMAGGSGHRSILRIGPAGENRSAMACINVDTYRHFGRLGGGAVMGAKNLKAIVIVGDESFDLPAGKEYTQLFQKIYGQLTTTSMMDKYHNLGTPINVAVLNEIQAMPCRNLQRTSDENISGITGETFAERTLLRNTACSGCPVGCIHLGFLREKFAEPHQYLYRQVTYDHEPIAAMGAMLSVLDASQVLTLLEIAEKVGLDVMSAGVALAWATEAFEKGLLSEKETLVPLKFGDAGAYAQAVKHLGEGANDFYRLLGQGTLKAAETIRGYGLRLRPRPGDGGVCDRGGILHLPGAGAAPFPPGRRRVLVRSEAERKRCGPGRGVPGSGREGPGLSHLHGLLSLRPGGIQRIRAGRLPERRGLPESGGKCGLRLPPNPENALANADENRV